MGVAKNNKLFITGTTKVMSRIGTEIHETIQDIPMVNKIKGIKKIMIYNKCSKDGGMPMMTSMNMVRISVIPPVINEVRSNDTGNNS